MVFSGSTGYTSAWRVERVIERFFLEKSSNQTSAAFAAKWSSRAVDWREPHLDYIIGGGEANTADGWYQYMRRVHISTANTSTQGSLGTLSLPGQEWRDFAADHAVLTALSTTIYPDGTTDADHGRRVYQFLVSSAIASAKWRTGTYRELLSAWGGNGTSVVDSSL
jgi:hypothetical protein